MVNIDINIYIKEELILYWSDYINWVILAIMFLITGIFIADLYKGFKDTKSLQKDHEKLSAEHDKMQNNINESIKQERKLLEKDTDRIISQNDFQSTLLNAIYSESKKRELQFDNLTVEQRDAYQQMQKFSFLLSEVSRLQTENSELRKENIRLENENKKLNARKYSHKK